MIAGMALAGHTAVHAVAHELVPAYLTVLRVRTHSSSNDGSPMWLLLAGFVVGLVVYAFIYNRYRNAGESHSYEEETLIEAQPVQGCVEQIDHIAQTTSSEIRDRNDGFHRARVHRLR